MQIQSTLPPSSRRWEDEIVYFAMTDRFCNGDPSNDQGTDPSQEQRFHGGDWQGIIDQLDNLEDLGVTALWISPPQENDRDFQGMDGYHGYWPKNFYRTEPAFGTMDKLKELVDRSHQKGMKVLLDLVLNHTGYGHPWAKDPAKKDWFHDPKIRFEKDLEKGSLFGLPDLAQENPQVEHYLIEMGKYWARESHCDGFRLDAIMHFPAQFQRHFNQEMKKECGQDFFLLGEAYIGVPERIHGYQERGQLDSVYDFPFNEAIRNVVARDDSKDHLLARTLRAKELMKEGFIGEAFRVMKSNSSAKQFKTLFAKDKLYKNPRLLTTLIENHDMPRFMESAGKNPKDKFKQALALEFTARGIPLIYYGAEDGMGVPKSDFRGDKREGQDPEMRAFVQKLTRLRKDSIALRRGEQTELYCDRDTYAFARSHPQETLVVVANFVGKPRQKKFKLPQFADQPLYDRLTGKSYPMKGDLLRVDLPANGVLVLSPSLT